MAFGISGDATTQEILEKYPILNQLVNAIHGSGVDYDWHAEESTKNVYLMNAYHVMDENGMYCAVCDFRVMIPKVGFMDFKVQCGSNHYYWHKHQLRDYLTDVIGSVLLDSIALYEKESVAPFQSGVRTRTEYDLIPAQKVVVQEVNPDGS